jgi:hypothetical protein
MWETCVFRDRNVGCKIGQLHDTNRACNAQNCNSYADHTMVCAYFRHIICPTCSKYSKCWTMESYSMPGTCQGTSEPAVAKLCHNLCTKAPSAIGVDQRYGRGW